MFAIYAYSSDHYFEYDVLDFNYSAPAIVNNATEDAELRRKWRDYRISLDFYTETALNGQYLYYLFPPRKRRWSAYENATVYIPND